MSSVQPSISTFQIRAKQNNFQVKIVIANGGIVGLDEGIIDDTCLVIYWINYDRYWEFSPR